jgi:hypothetical protein
VIQEGKVQQAPKEIQVVKGLKALLVLLEPQVTLEHLDYKVQQAPKEIQDHKDQLVLKEIQELKVGKVQQEHPVL